jgi:putative ABC transport system ATP-binding protein
VIEGTEEPEIAEGASTERTAVASATTIAIELHGVEKRVLDGLDATIHPGRLTVVTGPSGSGKTTLLHLIAGLDLADAGEVVVLGTPIQSLDREARAAFRRDHIALVAQEPPLVPFLSVRENVELYLGLRGASSDGDRAQETLAAVGLTELAEQRVSRLSTGEQERVAIARALASEPDLLIADEPTARLDYANALAIGALLSRIARDRGIAVLCATHDPALIEQADVELRL